MSSANFVTETTTSIAGTNGDGAVTLTQITGKPRFSSAFGTGARVVRYTIEDTVNKKYETGTGIVSSNVLTRTKPIVTWDGTTLSQSNSASPLQFGSSPTSGNIEVRMGPTAESQGVTMPGRNSSIAGDANWRDYPVSGALLATGGNGTSYAMVANTEYYQMYRLDWAGALSGIQFQVGGATFGNIKTALYEVGATGLPVQKIVDFNVISFASTGVKSDTTTGTWTPAGPIWLEPGWYAVGVIADAAITLLGSGTGGDKWGPTPLGRKNSYGYTGTIVNSGQSYSTGLPATPSLGSATLSDPGANSSFASAWLGLKVVP